MHIISATFSCYKSVRFLRFHKSRKILEFTCVNIMRGAMHFSPF